MAKTQKVLTAGIAALWLAVHHHLPVWLILLAAVIVWCLVSCADKQEQPNGSHADCAASLPDVNAAMSSPPAPAMAVRTQDPTPIRDWNDLYRPTAPQPKQDVPSFDDVMRQWDKLHGTEAVGTITAPSKPKPKSAMPKRKRPARDVIANWSAQCITGEHATTPDGCNMPGCDCMCHEAKAYREEQQRKQPAVELPDEPPF